MPDSWSNTEVELIVADYFNMLSAELAGEIYSKADHRKNILPLLNVRSEGSIEYKHQNISAVLANLGEEIVFQFERWNLIKIGKEKLAEKIEWVSKEQGDGTGFDILSKYSNGADKYIEVKATKLSKEAPFFFTRNELQFSLDHSNDFHL